MAGVFANDGSLNVSVVTGAARTGLYAADRSINVVQATGLASVGSYHPCGALWVLPAPAPSGATPIKSKHGVLHVSQSPYTNGGQKVTVVAGALT